MITLKNDAELHTHVGLDEAAQIEQDLQKQQEQQANSSDWTSAIDVVEIGSTIIDTVSDLVSNIDLSL